MKVEEKIGRERPTCKGSEISQQTSPYITFQSITNEAMKQGASMQEEGGGNMSGDKYSV